MVSGTVGTCPNHRGLAVHFWWASQPTYLCVCICILVCVSVQSFMCGLFIDQGHLSSLRIRTVETSGTCLCKCVRTYTDEGLDKQIYDRVTGRRWTNRLLDR